ncbi:hypothetical protein B0H10DRAFT_176767 [Mycena sp. CBHHK59/15]|nr:hypothetical protein B0H10DRAFT_176767 [Mycena sp. CBHHK59/15]
MPEVPAISSNAWNALLRSALTNSIQPKIGRRTGRPSCVSWSVVGDSDGVFRRALSALKPDESARTNELISNLTNIKRSQICTLIPPPPNRELCDVSITNDTSPCCLAI